jgi:anion-transporting  ArsA/GET3 family ATPase
MSIENMFAQKRVLICVGSGGIGKTTISATLGVMAAKLGKKVLVLTIDPSRRLKDALGIGDDNSGPVKVPNQKFTGELYAMVLNAEKIFHDFVVGASKNQEMKERLLNNRLYQQLSTTLSGSQEFTSLLQLSRLADSDEYDLIILDTPPAQHAIDFLEAPQKIQALFEENIVRWFIGDSETKGFFRKIISGGTRTVLGGLEKITGSGFMSELNDFFRSVRSVQSEINLKSKKVQDILGSSKTGFFLVSGFDEVKLQEAEELKNFLREKKYNLVGILINRAFVNWPQGAHLESNALSQIYKPWAEFHSYREKTFRTFSEKIIKTLPVFAVPDLNKELSGLESLEGVANEIQNYRKNIKSDRM